LDNIGETESSKKLRMALVVSNSTLEVLAETKHELSCLEKKQKFKKIDVSNELKAIRQFVSKYWPGY